MWLDPVGSAAEPIELTTERQRWPEVNVRARDAANDWSRTAFLAVLDLSGNAAVLALGAVERRWVARVELTGDDRSETGYFTKRPSDGSAGALTAESLIGGVHVQPRWSKRGLTVAIARPVVVADEVVVSGRTIRGSLHVSGKPDPATVKLSSAAGASTAIGQIDSTDTGRRFEVDVPSRADPDPASWSLAVVSARGVATTVRWAGQHGLTWPSDDRSGLTVRPSADGALVVVERRTDAEVDDVELCSGADPVLRIAGRVVGLHPDGLIAELRGPRERLPARQVTLSGDRFEVVVAMVVHDRWDQPGVAPLPGDYSLVLSSGDQKVAARVGQRCVETLPAWQESDTLCVCLGRDPEGLFTAQISGPLPLSRRSDYDVASLRRRYRRQLADGTAGDIVEGVYFESFNGQTANDNTLRHS